jgi:peptidoglycan hydrolase-like protein with peptidoglycan-binding domain
MRDEAKIAADVDHVPALLSFRQTLTQSAQQTRYMTTNERRAMNGLPPYGDEEANIPRELLELRLKRLAIAAQGGAPSNVVGRLPRLVEDDAA